MHRIDSDRLNMRFDDAWSQVSVVVPLVRAGSGAAAEVADYSGMIARASVLSTSTRHISNLVTVPSIVCVFHVSVSVLRLLIPRWVARFICSGLDDGEELMRVESQAPISSADSNAGDAYGCDVS